MSLVTLLLIVLTVTLVHWATRAKRGGDEGIEYRVNRGRAE